MPNPSDEALAQWVDQLRCRTSSDFAALALPDGDGRRFTWKYAAGNLNNRYKQMIVKTGRGLPGAALQTGRTVTAGACRSESGGVRLECSLMYAEALNHAAAIPVRVGGECVGLLMLGRREGESYRPEQLELLEAAALELARMPLAAHPKAANDPAVS